MSHFFRLKHWLTTDLWRISTDELDRHRAGAIRLLRMIVVAVRDFKEDKASLRASALTFYTLMSIVPLLAMAFGIAKGFGFEKRLEDEIRAALETQAEVVERAIDFARNLLENTQGGLVAGVGLAILVWTVVKVLSNIEESFNAIWGVTQNRTILRKFTDYLSFLFLSPILFVLSSSMTVFISSQLENLIMRFEFLGFFGAFLLTLMRFAPLVIMWALFTFTYMVLPNTRVSFKSAMVAGIIAALGFQITQVLYIRFQVGVSRANAIYGSFAALPLFLTWLQISWMIVLFGAELAHAHQNLDQYEWGEESANSSPAFRRKVALALTRLCVERFREEEPPPTFEDLRSELGAPPRLVREVLQELIRARVLAPVAVEQSTPPGYLPACDVDKLTIASVIHRLDSVGAADIPLKQGNFFDEIFERFESLRGSMHEMADNLPIKDLPTKQSQQDKQEEKGEDT